MEREKNHKKFKFLRSSICRIWPRNNDEDNKRQALGMNHWDREESHSSWWKFQILQQEITVNFMKTFSQLPMSKKRQNCGMNCELRTLGDVRNRFGKRQTNLWKIYEFPRKIISSSSGNFCDSLLHFHLVVHCSRHHHHHHYNRDGNIICIHKESKSFIMFIYFSAWLYLLPSVWSFCIIFKELKFFIMKVFIESFSFWYKIYEMLNLTWMCTKLNFTSSYCSTFQFCF